MLRFLSFAVQAVALGLIGYNALTALWGWGTPPPPPMGSRTRRLRVVVPAHNEERVIGRVLGDLQEQDYPDDRYRVWVIADRCTDRTAEAAAGRAQVAVRAQGKEGKGATLAWYLAMDPLDEEEALVVFDADNRLPPWFLAGLADGLDQGGLALQAYLDVANPDRSALALASALSYWASNRMVQLARSNLGWPVDLGGTGMCLTSTALQRAGGFGGGPTEDQELTARLARSGTRVTWLHHLRVRDEKPAGLEVAVRQRARWASGWRSLARRYVPGLLRQGLAGRAWGPVDLAIRLLQPGRVFLALVAVGLTVVGLLWPSAYLLPWQVWGAAALVHVLLPLVFLIRDGVPARHWLRYPVLVLIGLIWLPARLVGRLQRGAWYHTPHGPGPDDHPSG